MRNRQLRGQLTVLAADVEKRSRFLASSLGGANAARLTVQWCGMWCAVTLESSLECSHALAQSEAFRILRLEGCSARSVREFVMRASVDSAFATVTTCRSSGRAPTT